jgi:peroxiredoxin
MTTTTIERVPAEGELAPDFTADSTAGSPVTLSSFRGTKHVLLAFFPLAFTSVCTAELCDFSVDFDQFAVRNVAVLPVSVDSVPTLKEFKAKHGLVVDLLSDFKREISRAYGVLLPDRFFSTRAYFLIDRSGRIAWRHVEESPSHKRSNREILEHIQALA